MLQEGVDVRRVVGAKIFNGGVVVVDSAFGGDRGVGGGGRVATQTVVKVRTSVHHCEEDEGATEPL